MDFWLRRSVPVFIMEFLFAILALSGVGIAGYYYFKIYKPKKEQEEYEDENIEMSDGLETVNEDEEETKESK